MSRERGFKKQKEDGQSPVCAPVEHLDPNAQQDNPYEMDRKLQSSSEESYQKIAADIVDAAVEQLQCQNESKNKLKENFTKFFKRFLVFQYVVLVLFLAAKGFEWVPGLSDSIVLTYISAVFVETLGALIIMVRYAFDSAQETKVLEILNEVIKNYQKFKK